MLSLLNAGCGPFAIPPSPTTLQRRLAAVPTDKPIAALDDEVTIRWNSFQIPYIQAKTDADAAFALGLVHAHLRLGQMEVAKRITQGRLAEMGGPQLQNIDLALRTLDYYAAAEQSLAAMPKASGDWLKSYVDGVNFYKNSAAPLPHEYKVLGLKNEPWRAVDSIAIGKLAGTDVNWVIWFSLFPYMEEKDFNEVLGRLQAQAVGSMPSFDKGGKTVAKAGIWLKLARLGFLRGRSGSNSIVISEKLSGGKGALIANDPHLGFTLPNLWLIVGLRSPSYRVVGMMPPGVPVFGFGRNPTLAWGGTNLRAQASDLVDVSHLTPNQFTVRKHKIKSRWWFSKTATSRLSEFGPVISDAERVGLPPGKSYALAWAGHRPANEIGSLLAAMRAKNWQQFRRSFDNFAVPGQNFLAADSEGNIGYLVAAHLPRRKAKANLVMDEKGYRASWGKLLTAAAMPWAENPSAGYFASANNRPSPSRTPLISSFFPEDERIRRLKSLFAAEKRISLETLKRWQRDVYSPLSVELRNAVTARLVANKGRLAERYRFEIAALNAWSGNYRCHSKGALLFEGFIEKFYEELLKHKTALHWRLFAALGRHRTLLLEDLNGIDNKTWRLAATAGLKNVHELMASGDSWGDRHRFQVQHLMGQVPLVGGRYRYENLPSSGSGGTLKKSAHDLGAEKHDAFYGSQSRHLSDLGDEDANYFLLLGGNDGWINSANFADQIPLWQVGEYIRMPLSEELVNKEFSETTVLSPK